MTSKLFELNYEFKIEYSSGIGTEKWVNSSWTMKQSTP
jgi:hypothetical protein